MEIRTLTPREKRVIIVPDEEIGLGRYGTYVDSPRRPQDHSVAPAASMAMANRGGSVPLRQQLDLPTQARATGMRVYDRRVDAWIAPPPRPIEVDHRVPRPSVAARNEGGEPYWIYDRLTGARMRRICAQTYASAQQIAAEYALNHGLAAGDAYAKRED